MNSVDKKKKTAKCVKSAKRFDKMNRMSSTISSLRSLASLAVQSFLMIELFRIRLDFHKSTLRQGTLT